MSAAPVAPAPVIVTGAEALVWAARVAALTRAAYHGSDPLPGLPEPDGATDTASDVTRALSGGGLLVLSLDVDGILRAALRVAVPARERWHIERVAVDHRTRGRRLAAGLLSATEQAARLAGARRITLHAVVERCLPALYGRLGFDVIAHWPSDDKPLTEVTMERRLDAPARLPSAPSWRAPMSGAAVCWLLADRQLVRLVMPQGSDPLDALRAAAARLRHDASACVRLAGVDVWTGPGDPPDPTPIRRFGLNRAALAEFVAPRLVEPAMWAAWRFRPGAEPSADDVGRADGQRAW